MFFKFPALAVLLLAALACGQQRGLQLRLTARGLDYGEVLPPLHKTSPTGSCSSFKTCFVLFPKVCFFEVILKF